MLHVVMKKKKRQKSRDLHEENTLSLGYTKFEINFTRAKKKIKKRDWQISRVQVRTGRDIREASREFWSTENREGFITHAQALFLG